MDHAFDLEHAITNWRAFLANQESFSADDLDELEAHLREEIAARRKSDASEEEFFRAALAELGDIAQLEESFRDVKPDKDWSLENRRTTLASRLALAGNYVVVAWRNLRRDWAYSLLNLASLTIGIASCIVIGLFVYSNVTFDHFHPGAENIYRVITRWSADGLYYASAPQHLEKRVRANYADIRLATPVRRDQDLSVGVTGDQFLVEDVLVTDSTFFSMFGFEFLRGGADQTLRTPHDIVLTESTARRIFGGFDVLGQQMSLYGEDPLTVTGILADPPKNSYLQFDALRLFAPRSADFSFRGMASEVYLRFDGPEQAGRFETWLNEQAANEQPGMVERGLDVELQPLTRINFRSDIENQISATSDVRYFFLFGVIGLIVAIMAGFNHINLTGARAVIRNREVGVRKVMGATRSQLRIQFVGESVLVCMLSLPVALLAATATLPAVSRLIDEQLPVDLIWHAPFLGSVTLLLVILGIGGGLYPAIFQSRLSPSRAFQGGASRMNPRFRIRTLLVGLQMAASIILIAFSLVVARQLEFIRHGNLGFDDSRVVTLPYLFTDDGTYEAFRQQAQSNASIEGVAFGTELGTGRWMSRGIGKYGPDSTEINYASVFAGPGYLELMNIELLEGHSFSESRPAELENGVILSRSLARTLGENSPVGKTAKFFRDMTVIGIAEDIRNIPVNVREEPVAYLYSTRRAIMSIAVRIAPGHIEDGLEAIKGAWKATIPDRIFSYEFLDQRIQQQYASETRLARVFGLFTGLSILVACLGMVGLAGFSARRRRREVGIRKVMGAGVGRVMLLLSHDFLRVSLVAGLFAIPAAVVLGNRWLEYFSDRILISPWLLAGAFGLGVAMVLVSTMIQSWRAAVANPAQTLRHD